MSWGLHEVMGVNLWGRDFCFGRGCGMGTHAGLCQFGRHSCVGNWVQRE